MKQVDCSHNSTTATDMSLSYVPTEGNRGVDVNNNAMVRIEQFNMDVLMIEKPIFIAICITLIAMELLFDTFGVCMFAFYETFLH